MPTAGQPTEAGSHRWRQEGKHSTSVPTYSQPVPLPGTQLRGETGQGKAASWSRARAPSPVPKLQGADVTDAFNASQSEVPSHRLLSGAELARQRLPCLP